MTLQDRFIAVAKLLGGDVPRWQAAAATKLGITRSHMHHIHTGFRPVTQQMVVKAIDAARAEAAALRERAGKLDETLGELMPAPGEPLPPATDDQYQRDAAEAEAILEELAGVTTRRGG